MEQLAAGSKLLVGSGPSIDCITQDGCANMFEMDTDLVGAAGDELNIYPGEIPYSFEGATDRGCRFACWVHMHLLTFCGVSSDGLCNGLVARISKADGKVVFCDGAASK